MGYVVPFMNGKGGTGKSVLARAYAVEAARAGASVLIADLDDVQRTSKHWADHRKANGLKPEIRVEVATPRLAWDMKDRSDVLVIDTPGWTDLETLKVARWSTFCVIPSRANRMDDLSETVRLLHALKKNGIEDWRFGVALNALRAASAIEDDRDAREYLAEVGFKALPGFVRDLKDYEIALLEGKAITETGQKALNDEAFVLVNGIAGAVLEAGKILTRQAKAIRRSREEEETEETRQRRARAMTKSNFEKLAKAPLFARPPRPDEGASPIIGYGAVARCRRAFGAPNRPHGAVCNGRLAGIQAVAEGEGCRTRQVAGRAARRHEGRLHRKIRRRIAMLSLFKRKPKAPVEAEPVEPDQLHTGRVHGSGARRTRPAHEAAEHQGVGRLLRHLRGACRSGRHQQGRSCSRTWSPSAMRRCGGEGSMSQP